MEQSNEATSISFLTFISWITVTRIVYWNNLEIDFYVMYKWIINTCMNWRDAMS